MSNKKKMEGEVDQPWLEVFLAMAPNFKYLERIAVALERLAGPPREAACPECEGQNLSPDPLWYCKDCDLAHFGDSPSAFELRGVYRGNSLDKLD